MVYRLLKPRLKNTVLSDDLINSMRDPSLEESESGTAWKSNLGFVRSSSEEDYDQDSMIEFDRTSAKRPRYVVQESEESELHNYVKQDKGSGVPGILDCFLMDSANFFKYRLPLLMERLSYDPNYKEDKSAIGAAFDTTPEFDPNNYQDAELKEYVQDLADKGVNTSWIRNKDVADLQREYLESCSQDALALNEASFPGVVANIVGNIISPDNLVIAGLTGGVISGIGKTISIGKELATKAFVSTSESLNTWGKSLASGFNQKLGKDALKFIGIAGRVGKTGIQFGEAGAVFEYIKGNEEKFISVPIEDLGDRVIESAFFGSALGIGLSAGGILGAAGWKATRTAFRNSILFPDLPIKTKVESPEKHNLNTNSSALSGGEVSGSDGILGSGSLNSNVQIQVTQSVGQMPAKGRPKAGLYTKLVNHGIKQFPYHELLLSENPKVREFANIYMSHNFENLADNIASPVDSIMNIYKGLHLVTEETVERSVKASGLDREDFMKQLHIAQVTTDSSSNPHINNALRVTRKFYNKMYGDQLDAGFGSEFAEETVDVLKEYLVEAKNFSLSNKRALKAHLDELDDTLLSYGLGRSVIENIRNLKGPSDVGRAVRLMDDLKTELRISAKERVEARRANKKFIKDTGISPRESVHEQQSAFVSSSIERSNFFKNIISESRELVAEEKSSNDLIRTLYKELNNPVRLDENYSHRQFNVPVIESNYAKFVSDLSRGMIKSDPVLYEMWHNGKTQYKAEKIANEGADAVFKALTSMSDVSSQSNLNRMVSRNVKARILNVKSTDIMDWLVHDSSVVTRHYLDNVGFKIAERKAFQQRGYSDWNDFINKFNEDLFKQKSSGNLSEDQLKELNRSVRLMTQLPRFMSGEFDRLRAEKIMNNGYSKAAWASSNLLSTLNSVSSLGLVPVSMIVDTAIHFSKGNLCHFMKDVCKSFFGKKLNVLTKEELQRAGICLEYLNTNHRLLTETGLDESFRTGRWRQDRGKVNAVARGFKKAEEYFFKPGNFLDKAHSIIVSNNTGMDIHKYVNGTPLSELKYYKESRLAPESIKKIKEQIDLHSDIDSSSGLVTSFNPELWDSQAQIEFMSEIKRIEAQYVIRGGNLSTPLWARGAGWRFVTMFQGYVLSLTRNILLPMLHDLGSNKAQLAKFFVFSYGMEVMYQQIRGLINNNMYNWDDSELYKNAFERLPLIGSVVGITDFVCNSMDGKPMLKSARDILYNIAKGGNASYAIDLLNSAYDWERTLVHDKTMTESKLRNTIRVTPFINYIAFKPIMEYGVIPSVVENYDLKKRKTNKVRQREREVIKETKEVK